MRTKRADGTPRDAYPGPPPSLESVEYSVAFMSRIYGGIHFNFDNVEGKRTGEMIGEFVASNWLLPNSALPFARIEGFEDGVPIIRVHAHAGTMCVLEGSTDLNRWAAVASEKATIGGNIVREPQRRRTPFRFYRVHEE